MDSSKLISGELMHEFNPSTVVQLNIGGEKFKTTIGTLTKSEPESIFISVFKRMYSVLCVEGCIYFDRDNYQFKHILDWLEHKTEPSFMHCSMYSELLREAEYYQLRGLINLLDQILMNMHVTHDLTRDDIILYTNKRPQERPQKFHLHGINLSGLDLSRLNLEEFKFSSLCLRNACFSSSSLKNAVFDHVDAVGANFSAANLCGTKVNQSIFKGCNFSGSVLEEVVMTVVEPSGANFSNGRRHLCSFWKVNSIGANFTNADLHNTDCNLGSCEQSNFSGANLSSSYYNDVYLTGATFQNANLERFRLLYSTKDDVDPNFVGADLENDRIAKKRRIDEDL